MEEIYVKQPPSFENEKFRDLQHGMIDLEISYWIIIFQWEKQKNTFC